MALYRSACEDSIQFGEKAVRVFCFGFGYVARHLAAALHPHGIPVTGTARTAGKAPHILDDGRLLDRAGYAALEESTHVLLSIPPKPEDIDAAYRHYRDMLTTKQWLGYLSTTGVYGDYGGEWVDESSALRATEPRALARIGAERHWLAQGAQIFRLAGIYGKGRNALEQLRSGKARRIYKQGHYFSRIHVEDIVQVLLASFDNPQAGEIYNLCDDEPAPAHEVIAHAGTLLGQELPPFIPFETADLSPMAQSFYMANRRVSNRKIKESLGIRLRYPTYREGLASLLHEAQGV